MAQHRSLEIRVGAFIVSGLALLIFFIFAIGDFSTYLKPSYRISVLFASANGITKGSPVQYAGVEIGRVEHIGIVELPDNPTPQVGLRIQLPEDIVVREDDEAAISTLGLLGEKYLEITPGPGRGVIVKPGGSLTGKHPVSAEVLLERSGTVLTELEQTLQTINNIVSDPEAGLYFKETLREARDATRHWKVLAERLNLAMTYVESGQGTLGKILFDEELFNRATLLVEDLRANPWKLLFKGKKSD